MRRVEAHLGIRVGFWAGLLVGIGMGIRSAPEGPAVAWAGGLVIAGGMAFAGMMIGLVSIDGWNWLADQVNPRSVPVDGPEADYHDLPRPDSPTTPPG
jgi:hypothetical protein